MTRTTILRLAAVGLLIAFCRPAAGKVQHYYVMAEGNGSTRLLGVTVDRGGRTVTLDAARLISCRIMHFSAGEPGNLISPGGTAAPPAGSRSGLLGDDCLTTGVVNIASAETPPSTSPILHGPQATPGLAVRFAQPVVNLPGDDVVLFEYQTAERSPPGGDAFHVSPLRFAPGLKGATVRTFDFEIGDRRALPIGSFNLWRFADAPSSLEAMEHGELLPAGTPTDFKALAVAIDLSTLGYPPGAKVEGLFIQDAAREPGRVDPVLIAGLPAPEAPNLLASIPRTAVSTPPPGALLKQMLQGPMADVDEIVFAVRVMGFDHWYANFGHYAATVTEYPPQRGLPDEELPTLYRDGGRLCRLNLRTGTVKTLLDAPTGGVRDPQVSYDARKILFSYRKGGQPYYNLYEIDADGGNLRRLTDGPFDDIEPTYLPDGGIMFCSSRANRFVNCWRTPVATLYRCDGDGDNVRMLSTNVEHDNTPWPLPDGRVLYMRWEYVDRNQFSYHHLWTANPDGTGQMVFFGNQFHGWAMLDAKPIPGTTKIVASFSPGHGRPGHMGTLTVVDPATGPDREASARPLHGDRRRYRDPYPISEDCFLAADDRGIVVMDGNGNADLLYKLSDGETTLSCHEPRPLCPRPREPVIAPRVDQQKATGRLVLSNIYEGRNMAGVEPGEVKKLLVLEQLPQPISFSGGMWPISAGGTFTLARVLGTVPVDADGSADFEVPAMRSLFLVALDAEDRSVKRMQSFLTLQPGETAGCVGCHEQRLRTPLVTTGQTAFLRHSPSRIEPIADVPDVLDYPRDVQPILDRHCVKCHSPQRREGGADLTGDHTPLFCESFWTMMHLGLVSDGRNGYGDRAPRSIGTSASRLLTLCDGSHYDAKPSDQELRTLRLWIESSAVYAGTYAALGSGMHPVEFPVLTIEKRCGGCHGHEPPKRQIGEGKYFRFGPTGPVLPLVHKFTDLARIRGAIGYYKFGSARPPQSLANLTHPENSLMLRAPLARSAGGLELCGQAVFANTADADYRAILERIEAAAAVHREEKRFDMPGFRPNVYYIRIMQQYGVLPADLDPDAPIDVYATDRAYWQSFWCMGSGEK